MAVLLWTVAAVLFGRALHAGGSLTHLLLPLLVGIADVTSAIAGRGGRV